MVFNKSLWWKHEAFLQQGSRVHLHILVCRKVVVDEDSTSSLRDGLRSASSPSRSVLCHSTNHSRWLAPSALPNILRTLILTNAGVFVGS